MIRRACFIAVVLVFAAGCATGPSGPYREQAATRRDTQKAEELNRRAADLLLTEPDRAERLLREALSHDLHYGPAHNNLGIIFLNRGDLYEASSEFEWARKLMPGHPDPRLNLALALERGGQVEEAIATYESVLELRPELVDAMVALASVQLRHNRQNHNTRELLSQVVLRGADQLSRNWARDQLEKLDSRATTD